MRENLKASSNQVELSPTHLSGGSGLFGETLEPCEVLQDLAGRSLNAPVVVICLDRHRADGTPMCTHKIASAAPPEVRHMPRALTFCRQVMERGVPVAIDGGAETEPGSPDEIAEIGTAAYLGVPIVRQNRLGLRVPLGAMCVVDDQERIWSAEDGELLTGLASSLANQLALEGQVQEERRAQAQITKAYHRLARYSGLRDDIGAAFMAPGRPIETRFSDFLRASCRALDFDRAVLARVNCGDAQIVASHPAISIVPEAPTTLSNKLAGIVVGGGAALKWENLASTGVNRRLDLLGKHPAAYLGIPISLSGTLYGVLEMSRDAPFEAEMTDAEDAIISVIGLLAASNIEMLSQAERIRDSEMELMSALREYRALEP